MMSVYCSLNSKLKRAKEINEVLNKILRKVRKGEALSEGDRLLVRLYKSRFSNYTELGNPEELDKGVLMPEITILHH